MSERSGVILAGGEGTRLGNVTKMYNKQLALVYDRPMIEYPVQTMQDMGVDYIHIVSTPKGVVDMSRAYGDEINGTPVRFHEQRQPRGAADALNKTYLEGVFPVLCGDVYLDPAPPPVEEPTLFWHDFPEAVNHTVWDPETNELVEKPLRDIGSRAIIAYAFDERVYECIDRMELSERGELELIDVYRYYMSRGIKMREYQGFFTDMGTPNGVLRAASHEWGKSEYNFI